MHDPLMFDIGLGAELLPHRDWLGHRRGDVSRHIGLLVTHGFIPSVLMPFSDEVAIGIVMVFSEIESIDASATAMHERIADGGSQRVVASVDENWITGC